MNLTISINKLKDISIENCLNYSPIIPEFEKLAQEKIQQSIIKLKKYRKNTDPLDDKLKFILEQCLLRVSTHKIFLEHKDSIDEIYIYTLIKKQLYLQLPNLFQ
ncbi:hypothetical protein [Tepidibacter formicigenes]|uniref:Uncharacterized protein n=1 Tax=Tepidibacter formicigenes DSM 15518 TaxID=1123349 RepID=A0A1M6SS46_9FIRM|nr:hypothetical protein [Tepidibacter formicigenes]SHK47460.1 hypothetical protein SAMN02744037_02415 [Tepidibacter formicigenes DSM 15518]